MTIQWFDLIILALATWRVANIITSEDGPFGVFTKWRAYADTRQTMGKTFHLSGILSCVFCASVWVGAGLYALHVYLTPIVSYVFAISGLAMMLMTYSGVRHG